MGVRFSQMPLVNRRVVRPTLLLVRSRRPFEPRPARADRLAIVAISVGWRNVAHFVKRLTTSSRSGRVNAGDLTGLARGRRWLFLYTIGLPITPECGVTP